MSTSPTTRLTLLLHAFADEDEDEVCEQLDALREGVADHSKFPDVDRALGAFKKATVTEENDLDDEPGREAYEDDYPDEV